MKLTPRLQAIAELIPPGSIVADIGTDHAYLPVYLMLEQICHKAVAADVKQAPLNSAMETIAAFNCHQKVDLRRGNGLQILRDDDHVDTIVIAGLGGRTIAGILEDGREKLNMVERIILQPMSEQGYLRLFLARNGFAIVHETLAMEGRHLYEIIVARLGKEMEQDPFRLAFGPRLLEKKPPLFTVLLQEKKEDVTEKLQEVKKQLSSLEEVLASDDQRSDTD